METVGLFASQGHRCIGREEEESVREKKRLALNFKRVPSVYFFLPCPSSRRSTFFQGEMGKSRGKRARKRTVYKLKMKLGMYEADGYEPLTSSRITLVCPTFIPSSISMSSCREEPKR